MGMNVIKNENIVYFDVDDTLIKEASNRVGSYKLDYFGKERLYTRIQEHVDLLKAYKGRGYVVNVWSGNGYLWAEQVIRTLKLQDYVDNVMTKPAKIVDDRDFNSWCQRIYLA